MNKKYFYIIILFVGILSACSQGRDDVYNSIPDIEIDNLTDVAPSQVFFGDTVTLKPTIKYGDESDTTKFTFNWYEEVSSSLKRLSTGPVFKHRMDSLGTWTILLEVTNKSTKITESSSVSISVISRSQRGWYVLKKNDEGNTDMDLFQASSDGTIDTTITNLIKQDGETLEGEPEGMFFTNNFRWKAPGSSWFSSYITALIPYSNKDIAAMRVNDTEILSKGTDMFYDNMSGKSMSFTGGMTTYNQSILVDNGKGHIMEQGMQALLPVIPGTYSLSPYWTTADATASYMLGFDNYSHSFIYVTDLASNLSFFPNKYMSPTKCKISSNNMNGTISFMENTDGSLNPDTLTYTQRAYAIFNETNRNDRCILFGLNLAQIDPNQTVVGGGKYSPIMSADTLSYAQYPELKEANLFTLHKNYGILYFAYGNKIGSYSFDMSSNKYKNAVLTYPEGETVTYMHYVTVSYDTNIFSYFVVATHTGDGYYKIYRYTIAGNDFTEIGSPMTGKGEVKTVMYVSPYGYNHMNYIYRYY